MHRVCGRGLVIKDQKVLLIKRFNNGEHYFSIPGGKNEKHENVEETAIREVFEETGINVSINKLLGTAESNNRTHYLFLCNYLSGELLSEHPAKENENNTYDPVWLNLTNARQSLIQPANLKIFYEEYL